MRNTPLDVGRVVRSMAGRDAGREFLVVAGLDDEYVYIADGDLRKAEKPKKKKRRHLRATDRFISEVAQRLSGGGQIANCELRKWLQNKEGK